MKFKEKFSKKIGRKLGVSINEEKILFSIHTLVRFPLTKINNPNTPKTRFSEILDLMNKLQLPFLYFTFYANSI